MNRRNKRRIEGWEESHRSHQLKIAGDEAVQRQKGGEGEKEREEVMETNNKSKSKIKREFWKERAIRKEKTRIINRENERERGGTRRLRGVIVLLPSSPSPPLFLPSHALCGARRRTVSIYVKYINYQFI